MAALKQLRESYSYRMHDLSEFMKTLLQRFTQWFNRAHERTGRLWEQRFKSVLVEDGVAARTMAAYIDLNPVRAGICEDPAEYRWSSYGEAVAGGKKARGGLVRALKLGKDHEGTARAWAQGGLAKEYRALLLGAAVEVKVDGEVKRKGMKRPSAAEGSWRRLEQRTGDLAISKVIRHRVRYFTDGVVIGGREFVDEFSEGAGNDLDRGARTGRASRVGRWRRWRDRCGRRGICALAWGKLDSPRLN